MTDMNDWVGREEVQTERLERTRSDALTMALGGRIDASDILPHLHHWLHFWDVRPPSGVGPDGHPARGGFLPPAPLPRRMWAGGQLRFIQPLRFGQTVTRRSTIVSVENKSGRSGDLVFVVVRHVLSGPDGVAVEENQDLVYREAAVRASPPPGEEEARAADWRRTVEADPVLLFRYSALTMNGHRIHYDHPYATTVEHYPGLVVQGPLQASLMLAEAEARTGLRARAFSFRGLSPAIGPGAVDVCGARDGDEAETWIMQAGRKTMQGRADMGRDAG